MGICTKKTRTKCCWTIWIITIIGRCIEIYFQRSGDIPIIIDRGVGHIGITGLDRYLENCENSSSSEIIFDQGIGDIFSARVAGNFVNEDILGSMEFACKLAGTKVVVVLGHTACGAVKGACDDAKLGNLTALLSKIKPAVNAVTSPSDPSLRNSKNIEFVNEVAAKNVHLTIDNIRTQSPVLKELEDSNAIKIVGAMYDINNGVVTFY